MLVLVELYKTLLSTLINSPFKIKLIGDQSLKKEILVE